MSFQFTDDFKLAYSMMNDTRNHLFITGKAGTGKSTLLRHFKNTTDKNVVFLAPTGLAAINVGGQTIHSFFKFPPRPFEPTELKRRFNKSLFAKLECIVIDEVSMVRADILDAMDYFLKLMGPDRSLPFGGVQMIFIGDLFQLPPIVRRDFLGVLHSKGYESPFFFSALCLEEVDLIHLELTKIFRQNDAYFLNILNNIRNNNMDYESLEELNDICFEQELIYDEPIIMLCSTNDIANTVNKTELEKIEGMPHTSVASLSGQVDTRNLPCEEALVLKIGAQVMFTRNDTKSNRWVNGSIGTVSDIVKEGIKVDLINAKGEIDTYLVKKESWDFYKYAFDAGSSKISSQVVGSITQYPLKLAYAITIHKSQGMTFKQVVIDFGKGAFAPGQVYVAMSRCVSLAGIELKRKIGPRDIIIDQRVVEYAFQNDIL